LKTSHLEDEYIKFFPHLSHIKYVWYALWADLRLSPQQCELIIPLFKYLQQEYSAFLADGMAQFMEALQVSVEHNLALYVDYMPTGYTSMGLGSSFGCATCRGQEVTFFDDESEFWFICHICGRKSKKGDKNGVIHREYDRELYFEPYLLDAQLSVKEYENFIRAYLDRNGKSQEEIEAVVRVWKDTKE